jgi:catechol 2,3-dioxygenase-like lactoylglutathione lyase family enzyme
MKYLHTMVRVADLEVSLAFYRDALGLEVLSVRQVPAGPALPPAEPWASMPNVGAW